MERTRTSLSFTTQSWDARHEPGSELVIPTRYTFVTRFVILLKVVFEVSASDLRPGGRELEVESSSLGRRAFVVFLGKILSSHSASLHPKMLGSDLRWTGISSRGNRNTTSRIVLHKPEISAGTDEPLVRPV